MPIQTAYESFYVYLGTALHEALIQLITSDVMFKGLLILIFAIAFLITLWRFSQKYMPSGLFGSSSSKRAGASNIARLIACFFIGMAILKVDSTISISDYSNISWSNNKYISSRLPNVQPSYKVSFLFKYMTNTADGISVFLSNVVDKLFSSTNSQMQSPDYFYKAYMYAGTHLIKDPGLRVQIENYTKFCFNEVIHKIASADNSDVISAFFSKDGVIDKEFRDIPLESKDGSIKNCFELKEDVRERLRDYSLEKISKMGDTYPQFMTDKRINFRSYQHYFMAKSLTNYYLENFENLLGVNKQAIPNGTFSKIQLYFSKIKSFDGILHLLDQGSLVGSALTAERAREFSEYLQRAPHIKGIARMILIIIFPLLIFFVIAGKWKVLWFWFTLYFSISLWQPIWDFFYHLTTHMALSKDLMMSFGSLNDGVSLLGAELISEKLYQYYALYTWLQIIVGPLPTLLIGYVGLNSMIRDHREESSPEIINDTKNLII